MLEGVAVVGDVVVVVVGVGEEVVAPGEDVGCADVGLGKEHAAWLLDFIDLLGIVGKALAQLVAEIGVDGAVAHDLYGIADADAAVVGGDDDAVVGVGQAAHELAEGGVAEPREGERAVGGLVGCQLADGTRLGAGVRQHVDEVEHHDVQVVAPELVEVGYQLVGCGGIVNLIIGEGVAAAIAVELRLDERLFVEVFALLLVLVHPQVGEHLGNLVGHEAGEDGVAGILRGGGQNAHVEFLVEGEVVRQFVGNDAPLVEAEVVEHDEEHLLALVEGGEDVCLEDVGAHQRAFVGVCHPVLVVAAYEAGELQVGLLLLHAQHVAHAALGVLKLQLPADEVAIDFLPVVDGLGFVDEHGDAAELLLIARGGHLGDNLATVDVLLQREQNLVGVDGLDEVVGDFRADGLVHDVLLLALGDHDDGCAGRDLLDEVQRLQPAEAGHVLVEQDEVVGGLAATVDGIAAVRDGVNGVVLAFEEKDVRAQELYFVVYPEKGSVFHCSSSSKSSSSNVDGWSSSGRGRVVKCSSKNC